MMFEARISINGTALTDDQSLILRIAVDALAGLFKDQAGGEPGRIPFTDAHFAALSQIQALIVGAPILSAVH